MEFRSYCPTAVDEDLWGSGAEVQLMCASDSSIVVPTFYVKSRNVDGNFASWVCADGMSKTDVTVEFSDDDFTDGKISAGTVLARAVSAAGFSGYRFTSSSAAGFIGMIGDLKRESAEDKSARDIINSFAAAFCSYVIEGNGGEMVFVPFGSYYQAAGTSEIKHSPIRYLGKKQYSKLIMYSGDKTFTAGSGEAENTLMISTEFASAELCAAVFEEIRDFEYCGWTCEKGLAHEYVYPGAIGFSDSTLLCTNVMMYPSAAGIFFSASANAVPETDYAYRSQVQRQLNERVQIGKTVGNIQIGKNTTYFVNKSKASASRSADSGTAEKYGFSVGEKGVTEYDGAIISKAHPSQSVYTDGADGTDILTVKWNGENSSQDRRFKFTVTGKGTSDEKVTEMIFPDGTSMSLEGF